jgi:hypothetical protein
MPEGSVVVGHAGDGASDKEKERHHDADDARPRRPHKQNDQDGDTEDDWARRHGRVVDTSRDLLDDRPDGDDHRQRVHLAGRWRRANERTSGAHDGGQAHSVVSMPPTTTSPSCPWTRNELTGMTWPAMRSIR